MGDVLNLIVGIGLPLLIGLIIEHRMAQRAAAIHQMTMLGLVQKMSTRTKELHDWHNITGDDGVKIWYVRKSLETAIRDLTEVLRGVDAKDTAMHSLMNKVNDDLQELKTDLEKIESKFSE